jgi:large subunit ribosomal protein L25
MAYELQVETRTIFGKKVKALRKAGKIPAEIYGHGHENISVQIDEKILKRTLSEAGSTNLISVQVDNQAPVMALARNIQYSILKRALVHVDFYAVIMTETVSVSVPIVIIGKSPLIEEGGTLVTGLNTLDIEALPANLPASIVVDVSGLESFSDSISVADLTIPDGVTVHSSPDSLVATIQPPRLEEEIEEEIELEGLEEEVEGAEEADDDDEY